MINDIVLAFQDFLQKMSNVKNAIDPKAISAAVSDICRLSDVGLMKVCIYESVAHENTDKNTTHIIYEDGKCDDDKVEVRKVTGGLGVLIYTFMHKADSEPWTERIRNRLGLLISIMYVFNSQYVLNQMAYKYAYTDDNGYHNVRYFFKQTNLLSLEGKLNGKAAAQFNLKHFQAVNQQIGRQNGDIVMRSFIDGLNKLSDSTLPVCRLGGDNFIMLFGTDKTDAVVDYLSGTAISFGERFGERILISATAGIFVIKDDFVFREVSDLMDKLVPAAFLAKNPNYDDIVFYDDDLIKKKNHTVTIQNLFPQALENEEFLVYYQPKIDVKSCKLVGAEALCRWKHEDKLIPPNEFIPILEQNIDICKLDFYMIDHVCRDIRQWLDEGRSVVRISVNLSRKHMLDVDLLDHILEIVDRHNVPHEYIEVELTETTTDVEFKDLKRVVGDLQASGISASVDDFGIGYSSLNLIKEIPWNVIKIDKSIVPVDEDDEHSPRSVMFKYVVAMAREMGLECIAEGVETETQVNILLRSGCDVAQGFFFDRPLPCEEFETRL